MSLKEASWSPEKYIGMTANEVVFEILRLNPIISGIKVVSYIPRKEPRRSFEERLETGWPDKEWNLRSPEWGGPERYDAKEMIRKILNSSTNELIGVWSKVKVLTSFINHIPMVDFNPPSES